MGAEDEEDTGRPTEREGPAPGHLLPIGLGAIVAGAFLVVLLLTHPDVRAWLRLNLFLPIVARVLGRDAILVEGGLVEAGPSPYVTLALASIYLIALLLIRALLLVHGGEAGRRIGTRIRLDSGLALATMPFLAVAALVQTLAVSQLFHYPWAFLSVPPLIVHRIVAILLVSLMLALWTETGGRRYHRVRFLAAVLILLVFDLGWAAVYHGTTRPLPWWIPPAAVLAALLVYHAITIGGRLVSHRRALFSLGCLQLAFLSGYLVSWFLAGPWPVMDWTYAGQGAMRTLHGADVRLLVLTLGPPALIAVGAYTLGVFLHHYSRLANVWLDGLAVTALFAQTLDGWVTTLAARDPYNALPYTTEPIGPIASWAVGLPGGWLYFWGKLVFSLLLITLIALPRRLRTGHGEEFRAVLLAAIAGLGLAAGLRISFTLAMGL